METPYYWDDFLDDLGGSIVGYPNSWMVYDGKIRKLRRMRARATPIDGNTHCMDGSWIIYQLDIVAMWINDDKCYHLVTGNSK